MEVLCKPETSEMRRALQFSLIGKFARRTRDNLQLPTDQSLSPLDESAPKDRHAKCRDNTEHDGYGLLQPDGPRDGGAAQDQRREHAQLHAVGIAVLDAIPAEAV